MSQSIILEVAIDSVESALAAQAGGAARVELCADLIEGGTTPSAGMIAGVRGAVSIGVMVMIRPRGGDFCFSSQEFDVMLRDIQVARDLGADGIVLGILRPDGRVDIERTRGLVEHARPLKTTFHRAFDMTCDPRQALEDIIGLGIDRVLTSGQESSALEGLELIADLMRQAGERIVVMPGGGINERNVGRIVAASGAHEVHVSGRTTVDGAMTYRNTRTFMGGVLRPPEFSRTVADAGRIRAMLGAAESAGE